MRALSHLPTFRGDGSFRSWLFAIAFRTLNELARKRSSLPISDELRDTLTDPDPSPPDRVIAWDEAAELRDVTQLGRLIAFGKYVDARMAGEGPDFTLGTMPLYRVLVAAMATWLRQGGLIMTGGTPLFTTTPLTAIRSLAGALLLLMLIAFVVIETFGEERQGPHMVSAESVVITQPAYIYRIVN